MTRETAVALFDAKGLHIGDEVDFYFDGTPTRIMKSFVDDPEEFWTGKLLEMNGYRRISNIASVMRRGMGEDFAYAVFEGFGTIVPIDCFNDIQDSFTPEEVDFY